jgi:hypothetical protein
MRGPTPRLPLWIVARAVRPAVAEDVAGDLTERWQRDPGPSRVAANWRLLRVAFSVAWHARRERATDRQRDARLMPATGLGLDVRFAMRLLRRRPAATGAVVLTLGLALGSSTALFSVVNAWVLTPLPYAEPDRLVVVWETLPAANIDQNTPAPAVLSMWRDRATQLDAVAALRRRTRNLTGLGDPARLTEIVVEPAMLSFLGARAEVGRLFGADEARAPAPRVVVLSHAAWQQRFGGAPDVLGQFLTLDGEAHEVIGVMPSHVRPLGFDAEIWAPLAFTPDEWEASFPLTASKTWNPSCSWLSRMKRAIRLSSSTIKTLLPVKLVSVFMQGRPSYSRTKPMISSSSEGINSMKLIRCIGQIISETPGLI